jgi:hypothetical protein
MFKTAGFGLNTLNSWKMCSGRAIMTWSTAKAPLINKYRGAESHMSKKKKEGYYFLGRA